MEKVSVREKAILGFLLEKEMIAVKKSISSLENMQTMHESKLYLIEQQKTDLEEMKVLSQKL